MAITIKTAHVQTMATDLEALIPEESEDLLPLPPTPTARPMFVQYAAFALGALATAAIVLGAWNLREEARLARHQTCLTDAQVLTSVNQQSENILTPAPPQIAECFHGPIKSPVLSSNPVPGLVGLRLDGARQDLKLLGLFGLAKSGPDAADSIVVAQHPAIGTSLPLLSDVDLITRAP
jgi:hypothetical protein